MLPRLKFTIASRLVIVSYTFYQNDELRATCRWWSYQILALESLAWVVCRDHAPKCSCTSENCKLAEHNAPKSQLRPGCKWLYTAHQIFWRETVTTDIRPYHLNQEPHLDKADFHHDFETKETSWHITTRTSRIQRAAFSNFSILWLHNLLQAQSLALTSLHFSTKMRVLLVLLSGGFWWS